jgi:hypothetical protein
MRVVENKPCRKRCDECRRIGGECALRWTVIDDDCRQEDGLVAYGFESREEAEAYIRYPEVQQYPQPRH